MDINSQQIALVVEHPHDTQLARHLLRSIKHELTVYDAHNPHHRAQIETLQSDVVIVFHRARTNGKQNCVQDGPKDGKENGTNDSTARSSEDNQTKTCLPRTHPKRLIVLSDCHREDTIVDALDAGAHHYFDINEQSFVLKVRIEAALRSHQHHAMNILEVAPFKFNVERRKVTNNGKAVHLSPREFSLAYFLFSNYDRIVFDAELMVCIWTLPSSMDSRRIDTAICRIRKKMNLYEDSTDWSLQRLRQVGYQLINHATCKNQELSRHTEAPVQHATHPQINASVGHPVSTSVTATVSKDNQAITSLPQPTPAKPSYAIAG